jgi:4-amino-4-deoxy-L-arabinose transferase-like glycosyltransferase
MLKVRRSGLWGELGVLLFILAVAAFYRFTQLDTIPPGMTHDEAAFGAEAEMILSGQRPAYFGLGYGHEPLYAYLMATAFSLLGHTLISMRFVSAMCGLLVVLGTYVLARQMFGVRVAWISAAWMAVAFWPTSLSRQALRAITLPMLWLPAAWWFWKGIQVSSSGLDGQSETVNVQPQAWHWRLCTCHLFSGLLLGASFYTYMASRVTWIVYPLFALYLLLFKRARAILRQIWPGILITLIVAGLVALPLFLYLRANPASEVRVGLMMEPIRELLAGKPERVLRHTWNALRVFSWIGDRFWVYNIPGRPVFNWAGSVLFYAGLLIALWHWRDPRYMFVLLWLIVGMAPALVTTNEGIFLRAIVAQPATYFVVAVAFQAVGNKLQILDCRSKLSTCQLPSVVSRRWTQVVWYVLTVGLLVMEGARTWHTYFVDWPSRPETRNIYNHNLVATARYLDTSAVGGAIGISALYPLYYHDPWILRYVVGRDDLLVRWFDGRNGPLLGGGGIVYPGYGEARYVFSALTPLDPVLRSDFYSQASLIERHQLAPDDQNPYFEVWHWQGHDALISDLDVLRTDSLVWISPEVRFTQPELRRPAQVPVRFGDVMALAGYRLSGLDRAGDTIELVTYWRALRTVQEQDDWVTFVHLLDRDSQVVGGVDVLHCPPTGWQPGDVAVQVHRFVVLENAPRNQEAYLELGVYRRTTGRIPVLVDGQAVGDRVLLVPVNIESK